MDEKKNPESMGNRSASFEIDDAVNPVPRTYVRGFGALLFGMFGTFMPALTYGAFCGTG